MKPNEHAGADEWLDLLRERLEESRASAMREHLQNGCDLCEERRHWAECVLAAATEPLEEPPAAVLSRARALFREHRPRARSDSIRRLVARLLPPVEPALAGVRDATGLAEVKTFEAGPYLIEITEEPGATRGRVDVHGRVVEAESGLGVPGIARLRRGDRVREESPIDDLGEIVLRDVSVAGGTLELLLDGDHIQIAL